MTAGRPSAVLYILHRALIAVFVCSLVVGVAACTGGANAPSTPTATPPPLALVTRSITPYGPSVLYGLNATTGAVLWHTQFEGYTTVDPLVMAHHAVIPAITKLAQENNQLIVTYSFDAFDLATGSESSLGTTTVSTTCGIHGLSQTTVLFCGLDNSGAATLTAFSTSFAGPLWTASLPASANVRQVYVTGDKIVTRETDDATKARTLVALDAATGKQAWQQAMPAVKSVSGDAAVSADTFFQFDTLGDPFANGWRVSAFSLADGSHLWTVPERLGRLGSFVGAANGAFIYLEQGASGSSLIALSAKDGSQLYKQDQVLGAILSGLASDPQRVFVALIGSADRSSAVIGLSTSSSWTKTWMNSYPTQGLGDLSESGNSLIYALYGASSATAYAVSATDGSVQWQQVLA